MAQAHLSEWLPKKGQIYQEDTPNVVLCKPKLLPLKSVTLEKMEKMQKDAQEQVREQNKQERLLEDQNFGNSAWMEASKITRNSWHLDLSSLNAVGGTLWLFFSGSWYSVYQCSCLWTRYVISMHGVYITLLFVSCQIGPYCHMWVLEWALWGLYSCLSPKAFIIVRGEKSWLLIRWKQVALWILCCTPLSNILDV